MFVITMDQLHYTLLLTMDMLKLSNYHFQRRHLNLWWDFLGDFQTLWSLWSFCAKNMIWCSNVRKVPFRNRYDRGHKKLSLLSSNGQKMHICFILHEKKFTKNLLHHHVLLFRFVSVFAKKSHPISVMCWSWEDNWVETKYC